ncbi:MAG: chemotaxis protein CheW [Leptospiraceae bacterium]|nr:chemotaxis protein CheW [Leptospiraceae bacterium]
MKKVEKSKKRILSWNIDNHSFGVNVEYCFEVQKGRNVVEVPYSKNYITGIVNLRGDIVTVIDLFVLMGQRETPDMSKQVIVRLKQGDRQVAILADSVSEVIEISEEKLESSEAHLSENELKYIPNIARIGNKLILILEVSELFEVH